MAALKPQKPVIKAGAKISNSQTGLIQAGALAGAHRKFSCLSVG